MENNIFEMLNLLSRQNQNKQNQANNPSFANYPQEAFSNEQPSNNVSVQGFSQPDSSIMPLLMQMLGGKYGGLESLMKGGNFDVSSLFKAASKSTKKEGTAPKDDLIL